MEKTGTFIFIFALMLAAAGCEQIQTNGLNIDGSMGASLSQESSQTIDITDSIDISEGTDITDSTDISEGTDITDSTDISEDGGAEEATAALPGEEDIAAAAGNISPSRALQTALADCGADRQLGMLRGQSVRSNSSTELPGYSINFSLPSGSYSYRINAQSGEIISFWHQPALQESATSSYSFIGAERARQAALDYAKLSADEVIFKQALFKYHNGMPVYDVEFAAAGREYQFLINAISGVIVEYNIN